jgi:HPt (histidine-containing phosphotransfer) domain-containing protein
MTPLFDETELLERVDHDWAFLGETVEMLAADGPALLRELRQSVGADDAAAAGRAAHALKGMIANFCAPAVQASAFEVERMGKTGALSGAPAAVAALEAQLQTLTAELQALVARAR